MTKNEIYLKLKNIIYQNFLDDKTIQISEETLLIAVGIDSVALMTLFVLLEEEFDFLVNEEDIFLEISTLNDLINYVQNKISE